MMDTAKVLLIVIVPLLIAIAVLYSLSLWF